MSSSSSDSSSDGEEPRLEMGQPPPDDQESQDRSDLQDAEKESSKSSSSDGEGNDGGGEAGNAADAGNAGTGGGGRRILDSDSDFDAAGSPSPPPKAQASPTPPREGANEESGDERAEKKPSSSSSSESDDKDEAQPASQTINATQEELFGDADDLSSSSDDDDAGPKSQEAPDFQDARRSPQGPEDIVGPKLHVGEEEEGDEGETVAGAAAPPETLIEVQAPRIKVELGNQIHLVKFPNFLSVECRPFEPETYEDEIDEDDLLDEEGRSRLKLKVENTIRWRQVLDPETNEIKKESNAKFVRWSDGSLSLYLGNEIFDVHVQPTPSDHNHLFIRQGAGLQGQEMFKSKLTFRPHSTDTLTHRKMTMSMADRSQKAHTVKVLAAVGKDPETQKAEMVRREEERMRTAARREAQQRRLHERSIGFGARGLTSSYLEERSSSEDEGESISAIKKSYKPGGAGFEGVGGGGAGSDSDSDRAARLHNAKRTLPSDDDDSDADIGRKEKKKRVIEDSDEEGAAKTAAAASPGSSQSSRNPSPAPQEKEEEEKGASSGSGSEGEGGKEGGRSGASTNNSDSD